MFTILPLFSISILVGMVYTSRAKPRWHWFFSWNKFSREKSTHNGQHVGTLDCKCRTKILWALQQQNQVTYNFNRNTKAENSIETLNTIKKIWPKIFLQEKQNWLSRISHKLLTYTQNAAPTSPSWGSTTEQPSEQPKWLRCQYVDYRWSQLTIVALRILTLLGLVQDGRVEGMLSLTLARTPKSQLTAEQSATGRHWNSPKKIPHIQTQRRSHNEMVGGAQSH